MSSQHNIVPRLVVLTQGEDARSTLIKEGSNELIFAVVGGAGSGTSRIATDLEGLLRDTDVHGRSFDVVVLKASNAIREWAGRHNKPIPSGAEKTLEMVRTLQDYGDEMRAGVGTGVADHSAVARSLITEICKARAGRTNVAFVRGQEVKPDGAPRAYIPDALRHPAEVELLRQVYGDAFVLIGVVCETAKREERIKRSTPMLAA